MLNFFSRIISQWDEWESDLKQTLAQAVEEGWTVEDKSNFFRVELYLKKDGATGTYKGRMSDAVAAVRCILSCGRMWECQD
jgi:hypothetical protein